MPLPGDQVSVEVDGVERLRWHFSPVYPRPFFYPLVGPLGEPLTRMGHPGAANHDHHRSIWFAHQKVLGVDFWSDQTDARVRQLHWLAYEEGDDEAAMAVELGWFDGHDPRELLRQELIVGVRPGDGGETFVELQAKFTPTADSLELGQTNFGFLAVRVAARLSAYFGGGELTNSEGRRGEAAIFGKPARWMDYSGPARPGALGASEAMEGITYFDHPSNPGFPNPWHVREDGWMGASPCMHAPLTTTKSDPLVLRYLLHAHRGDVQRERADEIAGRFAETALYRVDKASVKHRQYSVVRAAG